MLFPSPADPHTGSRTVDLVFGVVVVALIGLTVTGVAQGNLAIAAPGWDLVLDAVTTVVVLAVALLAFARYRVRGDATSLFQCAALVVLTVANMSTIVPGLTGSDPVAIRGTPSNQVPFFVVTFAQLLAAAHAYRYARADAVAGFGPRAVADHSSVASSRMGLTPRHPRGLSRDPWHRE